jgi:hypothetical protein
MALALLAAMCLAAGDGRELYLRSDYCFEQVVPVNRGQPEYAMPGFAACTNGCEWVAVTNWHWTKTLDVACTVTNRPGNKGWPIGAIVTKRIWLASSGSEQVAEAQPVGSYDDNFMREVSRAVAVATNGYSVGGYMREGVQLPCRLGILAARANSTSGTRPCLRLALPASVTLDRIGEGQSGVPLVVDTGFDGYLRIQMVSGGDEADADTVTIERIGGIPHGKTDRHPDVHPTGR